jgi:hypothetical protein
MKSGRILLQWLLAAALLVAQFSALTHALHHAPVPADAQVHAAHSDGDTHDLPLHLCDFHASLAQVSAALGACGIALPIPEGRSTSGIAHPAPATTVRLLAPSSRGPPETL